MNWQKNIIQMQVRQLTKIYLSKSQLLMTFCLTQNFVNSTISVELKRFHNRLWTIIKAQNPNGTHLPEKNQPKLTVQRPAGLLKNNTNSMKIKEIVTKELRVNTPPAISNSNIQTCSIQAKVKEQLPSSTFSSGYLQQIL